MPGQLQPQWQQWSGGQHRRKARKAKNGGRKGLLIGLGGGGVAAVAVVVILFLLFGRGPELGYEMAWSTPPPKGEKAGTLLDSYVAGDLLVRTSQSAVTAYGLDDGERAWQFKPPSGQLICTITPNAPAGTAVVVYGVRSKGDNTPTATGMQCTEAAAIDMKSGKRSWRAALPKSTGYQVPAAASAAVINGVAVVSNGRVAAFDVKTGEQKWNIGPADTAKCRSGDILASDKVLLALVDCIGKDESKMDDILVSLNPAAGTAIWKAAIKNAFGTWPPMLLNVSPPVLRLEDETNKPEVGVLDDQGKNPRLFPVSDKNGPNVGIPHKPLAGTDPSDDGHKRYPVAVAGNTLVGMAGPSTVAAMDLGDGKQKWTKKLGGQKTGTLVYGPSPPSGKVSLYVFDKAERVVSLSSVNVAKGTLTHGANVQRVDKDATGTFAGQVRSTLVLSSGNTLAEIVGADATSSDAVTAYTAK